MDKYEFNIKAEQIKKLTAKGDYDTAMRIADTIDWRRVRNTNLLSLVSQIYEKNEDYREAKDILLLAFERAPVGKRLLFKLSELSLKEHNLEEAEEFYREFCDLAPEDPRQHLLRYMILKERHAPLDQLIHSLERYTALELDEKWLYELAELYHKAGMDGDCVRVCDKIMLMFGLGKYVEKAMDLKIQHAPLNTYQMDLVENRDKYEEKLRAVEQGIAESAPAAEEGDFMSQAIPLETEAAPMGLGDAALADLLQEEQIPVAAPTPMTIPQMQPVQEYVQEPAMAAPVYAQVHPYYGYQPSPAAATQPVPVEPEPLEVRPQTVPLPSQMPQADGWQPSTTPRAWFSSASYAGQPADPWPYLSEQPVYTDTYPSEAVLEGRPMDEEMIATVKEAEAEERLAQELSMMSPDGLEEPVEDEFHKTRVLYSIKEVIPPHVMEAAAVLPELEKPKVPVGGFPPSSDMGVDSPFPPQPVEAPARTVSIEMEPEPPQMAADAAETPSDVEDDVEEPSSNHLMIEARDPQKGLELALNTLKQIHRETGSHNSVAKISAKKLNHKGLLTVSQQLEGKDLVIQDAGDLSEVLATELEHWMGMETGRRVVILIDNPMQMEKLHSHYSALSELFECIGDVDEPEVKRPEMMRPKVEQPEVKQPQVERPEVGQEEKKPKTRRQIKPSKLISTSLEKVIPEKEEDEKKPGRRAVKTDVRPAIKPEAEAEDEVSDIPDAYIEETPLQEPLEEELPDEEAEPEIPEEQMDIDEFAQYACKYAKEIDCSITGKSMLALYERIEIMEEEGVPLTASNAEELIEEAADKAEKPSLLRLLTGMFTPKYDKDDYLILREEHFI